MSELRYLQRDGGTQTLQVLLRGVWTDVPVVQDIRPRDPLAVATEQLRELRAENLRLRGMLDADGTD